MNCPSCNTLLHVQSDGQLVHPKADACAFSLVGLYPAGWEAVYEVKRAAFAEAAELAAKTLSDWLHESRIEKDDLDYAVPFMQQRIRALAAPEQKE